MAASRMFRLLSALAIVLLAATLLPLGSPPPVALAQAVLAPFKLSYDSDEKNWANAIAWGDVDNDGDLDLAVANDPQAPGARLYLNVKGSLQRTAAWVGPGGLDTNGLAWGDVDNDGDLDLAMAHKGNGVSGGSALLFRNCTLTTAGDRCSGAPLLSRDAAWSSNEPGSWYSVAWGDVDNDSDLDLAVGSYHSFQAIGDPTGAIKIFRNQGGALDTTAFTVAEDVNGFLVYGLAFADFDRDGLLDLAATVNYDRDPLPGANSITREGQVHVYRNDQQSGSFKPGAIVTFPERVGAFIKTISLGDYDADGRIDISAPNGFIEVLHNNSEKGAISLVRAAQIKDPALAGPLTTAVWSDYDGDGDLDLAAGDYGGASDLYRNDTPRLPSGGLPPTPTFVYAGQFGEAGASSGTVDTDWGDMDGDGDLDLALANFGQPIQVFLNERSLLPAQPELTSTEVFHGRAASWGDYDNDEDLDLVIGTTGSERFYRNETPRTAGSSISLVAETLFGNGDTRALAWGDVEGDGDLDLALSEAGSAQIYRNTGGTGSPPFEALTLTGITNAYAVAWADYDGDGDLDLAFGQHKGVTLVRNDTPGPTAANLDLKLAGTIDFPAPGAAVSLAWGDLENDGDLDLAVGVDNILAPGAERNAGGGANYVFRNGGSEQAVSFTPYWTANETDQTKALLWLDYDDDGDLDLFVATDGYESQGDHLYRNDSAGLTLSDWRPPTSYGRSAAAGDIDADGDIDLVIGRDDGYVQIYRNERGVFPNTPAEIKAPTNTSGLAVDLGDVDSDGDLDLLSGGGFLDDNDPSTAQERPFYIFRNTRFTDKAFAADIPFISVQRPVNGASASGFSTPTLYESGTVSIPFILNDAAGTTVAGVRGYYSLNGGNTWREAKANNAADLRNLPTRAPAQGCDAKGCTYAFEWDVYGSGFFGQSDNVVVKLVAAPSQRLHSSGTAGPYPFGARSSTSAPIRVRGNQIRVLSAAGAPVKGAIIYKLASSAGGTGPLLINIRDGQPWQTDNRGYLQGRVEILDGERFLALKMIGKPASVAFYQTSAKPTLQDVDAATFSGSGIHELRVTPDNPLMLVDLVVSLEWDATGDPALNQIKLDIQRASRLLYDWSNGQVAIGNVRLYQNKENWFEGPNAQGQLQKGADVRIYATNRMRPSASQGGITTSVVSETVVIDGVTRQVAYDPGEVRIGVIWNRDGSLSGEQISQDWARTLAHELGHYALYLDDNYLGIRNGQLIPLAGCRGAMADPYEEPESEFHPDNGWQAACADTLSNRTTGRSDWATLKRFYDNGASNFTLKMPATYEENEGPLALPFAATSITEETLSRPGDARRSLTVIRDSNGKSYAAGRAARAFAFDAGFSSLVDLGRPLPDGTLPARGPADHTCVLELDRAEPMLGCASRGAGAIRMAHVPGWNPDIRLSAVTSNTVTIVIPANTVVPTGSDAPLVLNVRLFPTDSNTVEPFGIDMPLRPDGTYQGTLEAREAIVEGYLLVRVAGDASNSRLAVTDYALGGSPAPKRRSKTRNKRRAPLVSPDGQVVLYTDNVVFGQGQFFSLQTATRLPNDPPVALPITQGYRLIGNDAAIALLEKASISLSYTPEDLGELAPETTFIYFYPEGGSAWEPLNTIRDPSSYEVAATVKGRGLYVVMASALWRNLSQPGLNLNVRYPGATAPLPDALTPLTGNYTYVYGYMPEDEADPWKVYARTAPFWVNDLKRLEYDERYHIMVLSPLTAPYKPPAATAASAEPAQDDSIPQPPALIYATLKPGPSFNPAANQPVVASFGEKVCAETLTRTLNNEVVFSLDVPGALEEAGCGELGRSFTLTIGDYTWPTPIKWNNETVYELGVRRIYLPQVRKPAPPPTPAPPAPTPTPPPEDPEEPEEPE